MFTPSTPSTMTLATTRPDEAHQHLARVYASHEVRLKGRVDHFRFRFRDTGLGGLSWSVLEHSHASVITDIAPFGHPVELRHASGAATAAGREPIPARLASGGERPAGGRRTRGEIPGQRGDDRGSDRVG